MRATDRSLKIGPLRPPGVDGWRQIKLGPLSDDEVEALWPPVAVQREVETPRAFRAAYRQYLFSQPNAVGALAAESMRMPVHVVVHDDTLGLAVAGVLEEFLAAWAPC